jgi:lipopolysaccharide/colanic/teichoic acid biosynthesis glycosyltransferase
VGLILRRSSLDELPQLFNVARGDMSLVGPRPELVEIVAGYEEWQHRRHTVKPGLTGRWQVSGRGDGPMHSATHLDLHYVDHACLGEDLRIMLLTLPALLHRRSN